MGAFYGTTSLVKWQYLNDSRNMALRTGYREGPEATRGPAGKLLNR
jgi:hypothetical protein